MKFDKTFTIELAPNCDYEKYEPGSMYGKITIGDFYEHFYMSPSIWTIQDYQHQWQLAWNRIKTHSTSCFIVTYQSGHYIEYWVLFKEQNIIYIHNLMAIEENFENIMKTGPLTPESSFKCITKPRIYKIDEPEPNNNEPEDESDILLRNATPSEWSVKIISE